MFSDRFMQKIKGDYYHLLRPIMESLHKRGIEPNTVTAFSFIFGLLAFWFLFRIHFLFVIFGLLHVILDVLDGNLARFSKKSTKFGYYFDYFNDRIIQLIIMLKVVLTFSPFWRMIGYVCIFLLVLHHLMHIFVSRDIVYYSRSIMLLILAFEFQLAAVVLCFGITSFGLLKQLESVLRR